MKFEHTDESRLISFQSQIYLIVAGVFGKIVTMEVKYFLCCIRLEVFATVLAILQLTCGFILSVLLSWGMLQEILYGRFDSWKGVSAWEKMVLVIVLIFASILAFFMFMNIQLIRGVMRRDAGPVDYYIYYLLVIYVIPMVYYVWQYIFVTSGYSAFMIYAVATSVVGLYFIICLRSLKLKFLNEKLPIDVPFKSRVEVTDVTSPLVDQPTMV